VDTLNKVLASYLGKEDSETFNLDDYLDKAGIHEAKEFDASRYDRLNTAERIDHVMTFFEQRGLSRETAEVFAPFMELVRKKADEDGASQKAIFNLGFPYHIPGSTDIVGYEIRGYKGFKGKAEGTNSSSGLWLAEPDATHGNGTAPLPHQIRKVYFFESAFDAMAFWQINHQSMDLSGCLFASTGGSFSDQQITETMAYYRHAQAVDCFDNDLAGRIYGIRMASMLAGRHQNIVKTDDGVRISQDGKEVVLKECEMTLHEVAKHFSVSKRVSLWKPPKEYKDWNDVIMDRPWVQLAQKDKFERDAALEKRRSSKISM
jgi:hypothetical protein